MIIEISLRNYIVIIIIKFVYLFGGIMFEIDNNLTQCRGAVFASVNCIDVIVMVFISNNIIRAGKPRPYDLYYNMDMIWHDNVIINYCVRIIFG